MDLKTRYKVAGIGKEQVIDSKLVIDTDSTGEKIVKVQDRWDGELPDGAFKNVSMLSLWSWVHYAESWAWWTWSFAWETRWWQVCGMPAAAVISYVVFVDATYTAYVQSADVYPSRLSESSMLSRFP